MTRNRLPLVAVLPALVLMSVVVIADVCADELLPVLWWQQSGNGGIEVAVGSPPPRRPGRRVVVGDDEAEPYSNELHPGVYELYGIDPGMPDDDLAPFAEIVGDAQVVALGESIHTSGGYYQAKHRLFRYLVEELGFRAFAFESPWTNAEKVREYVETCRGSAHSAVSEGLFGVWASQEVLDLVEWMCSYNLAHPDDPVTFWGFDIQQPWDDGPLLLSFLQDAVADPDTLVRGIERCDGVDAGTSSAYRARHEQPEVEEADHLACMTALDQVEQLFATSRDELVRNTSVEELEWATISLMALRAWQGEAYYVNRISALAYESRDLGMARVLEAIKRLRNPDDRIAVWAHNWHIAYRAEELQGLYRGRTMGSFLKESLGDSYLAVGLVSYRTSINWRGVGSGIRIADRRPDAPSLEYTLLTLLNRDYLLLDLAFPDNDEPPLERDTAYWLGDMKAVPAHQFGALLYLEVSPAMHPLNW